MTQERLEILALKHLVQNSEIEEALKRGAIGLKLRYFEKVPAQHIAELLFKYYTEYKEMPHTSRSLMLYAKQNISSLKDPLKTWCIETAHKIYQKPLPEEKF